MVTYEEAKSLVKKGFSVFPVNLSWDEENKKFEKKPAVAWKEYQTRFPTDEELHRWFDDEKYNGIGIATGKISGVIVVDIEKEDKEETIKHFGLKSPRISNTISGGQHFFFKNPEFAVANTVRIEGRKVDLRGDGGFVVAPPSSCDGSSYTWESEGDDLPVFSLRSREWKESKGIEKLDMEEYTAVPEGSRNDSIYKVSCSLLNKHDQDEAWSLVQGINAGYQPPLDERELARAFRSAVDFVEKNPGIEPSSLSNQKLMVEDDKVKAGQDMVLLGDPIPWSQIREEDNKKEWLWENYIAKRNITLLSALWKAGKTTFLRCLFLAMRNEEEFAGQPTKKNKILVISEEAKGEWSDNRDDLNDNEIEHVLVWSRPIRGKPNLRQWHKLVEEVTKKCLEEDIDMIVIDTLTTFWPIDNENDSAQVIKALVPLYSFTENNIAVVLVHHFRKGGGDQAQASRGSGALPGFVDNIIEFTRSDSGFPNQRTLKTYGRFDGVIPEVVIELNDEGKYDTKGEPWKVSKTARLNKILQVMNDASMPLSTKEIMTVLAGTMGQVQQRTVQRYIKELIEKGVVEESGKRTVADRSVPVYTQTGWIESMRDNPQPPPMKAVASHSDDDSVAQPVADDTKTEATNATRQASLLKGVDSVALPKNARNAEKKDKVIGQEKEEEEEVYYE